jgi:hypothetical protein
VLDLTKTANGVVTMMLVLTARVLHKTVHVFQHPRHFFSRYGVRPIDCLLVEIIPAISAVLRLYKSRHAPSPLVELS